MRKGNALDGCRRVGSIKVDETFSPFGGLSLLNQLDNHLSVWG